MVFRSSRRPINSVKKVIDASGGLAASTPAVVAIADATGGAAWIDAGDTSVAIGCTISSIYLSVFIYLDSNTVTDVPVLDWYIHKNPGNNLSMPEPGATGGNDNRRWIMHEEKGLATDVNNGGTPMIFKGVIRIPKGRQRMGNDDNISVRILSENYIGFFCVKAIYKFYR